MKSREGFTLIELLVVISIIALLISILMPSLGQARRTAQQVQCLSNQRQHSLGVEMYAQAFKDVYPSNRVTDESGNTDNSVYFWMGTVGNIVGAARYNLYSENDRPLNGYMGVTEGGGNAVEITRCPSDSVTWLPTGTSYASNTHKVIETNCSRGPNGDIGNRRGQVPQPANFVVLSEAGAYYSMYNDAAQNPANDPGLVDNSFNFSDLFWHSPERKWNALFGDGHAAVISIADYYANTNSRKGDGYTFDYAEQ